MNSRRHIVQNRCLQANLYQHCDVTQWPLSFQYSSGQIKCQCPPQIFQHSFEHLFVTNNGTTKFLPLRHRKLYPQPPIVFETTISLARTNKSRISKIHANLQPPHPSCGALGKSLGSDLWLQLFWTGKACGSSPLISNSTLMTLLAKWLKFQVWI